MEIQILEHLLTQFYRMQFQNMTLILQELLHKFKSKFLILQSLLRVERTKELKNTPYLKSMMVKYSTKLTPAKL